MQIAGVTTFKAGESFEVTFSDEFDAGTYDLRGRTFPLALIGATTRIVGGREHPFHEFAFVGEPICNREGDPIGGKLVLNISPRFEDWPGPWGARVCWFDRPDRMVSIGRAGLALGHSTQVRTPPHII